MLHLKYTNSGLVFVKLFCFSIILLLASLHICQGQTQLYLTPLQLGIGFEHNPSAYGNPVVFATGLGCEFSNRITLEVGANFANFSDETYRDQMFGGGWFGDSKYAQQTVSAAYLMAGRGFKLSRRWQVYTLAGLGLVNYKYPVGIGGTSGGLITGSRSWVLYNSTQSACLPVHACLQYRISTLFRGQFGIQQYFNRSFGYGMAYLTLAIRIGKEEQSHPETQSKP